MNHLKCPPDVSTLEAKFEFSCTCLPWMTSGNQQMDNDPATSMYYTICILTLYMRHPQGQFREQREFYVKFD